MEGINMWHKLLAHLNQCAVRYYKNVWNNFRYLKVKSTHVRRVCLERQQKNFKSHFDGAEQFVGLLHFEFAGRQQISLDSAVYCCQCVSSCTISIEMTK